MPFFLTYPQQEGIGRSVPSAPGYLLDTYSTGAAFAYGLRKLSSTAPSNCIRVRRSSDSTEQDIGYSGDLLDEASLLTFTGAGDGFITKWYDQTANVIDVAQTTAAAQPQIVSQGVVLRQGIHPCVSFDGTDDRLVFGSNNLFNNKTDGAIFLVTRYKSRATIMRAAVFVATAAGGITRISMGATSGGKYGLFGRRLDGDSSATTTGASDLNAGFAIIETGIVDWGNSNAYIYVNGIIDVTNTAFQTDGSTTNVNSSGFSIGGNHSTADYAPMNCLEVIGYNTNQSSNRTGIEAIINYHHFIY